MKIVLQTQLLITCLLIAVSAASNSEETFTWGTESDEDLIDNLGEFDIDKQNKSLKKEDPNIIKQPIQITKEQIDGGMREEELSIDLQKIELDGQSSESLTKIDVWHDLMKLLYENPEKEQSQEIIARLEELLSKCLEQPDKVGRYPNQRIELNLSFGIQHIKLATLAILSEYNRLTRLKRTNKYQIKDVFEKCIQETDDLLETAKKCLWHLGLITCGMHIIEESEELHDFFNQNTASGIDTAFSAVSQHFQETHKSHEKDYNLHAYIIQETVKSIQSEGAAIAMERLITVEHSPRSSSESIIITVGTRYASKTITRGNNNN